MYSYNTNIITLFLISIKQPDFSYEMYIRGGCIEHRIYFIIPLYEHKHEAGMARVDIHLHGDKNCIKKQNNLV